MLLNDSVARGELGSAPCVSRQRGTLEVMSGMKRHAEVLATIGWRQALNGL